MVSPPATQYAIEGGRHVAYQVAGTSGPDLLFVPQANFPIDLIWDEPLVAHPLRRLASFSRLILCDLAGVGSSDSIPFVETPAMQSWADGIAAVLDAAGSDRACVFATSETALPTMLFAAGHPERVSQLVLWSPYAHFLRTHDQPWGMPPDAFERYADSFAAGVGTGPVADLLAPSHAADPGFRRWWTRCERLAAGPGEFRQIYEFYAHTDVRRIVASIQAPTLVLRNTGDRHVRDGHARAIVEQLSDVRFVELDGDDNAWFAGHADEVVDEIESFVTGGRASAVTNRVLSTVLFTDIVGSTERAAAVGDGAWTAILEAHDGEVAQRVSAARGILVKFTGDGILATFDGPARAIQCAIDIRDALRPLDLEIRGGLHTGEVEVTGDDVHGIAVHIAARIMALAEPGEILVSGAIPPLVLGSGLAFIERGLHDLKGVPDQWPVFQVSDRTPPP